MPRSLWTVPQRVIVTGGGSNLDTGYVEAVTIGGATAGGVAPAPRVVQAIAGATGGGLTPSGRVTLAISGATGGGLAPGSKAIPAIGGVQARGVNASFPSTPVFDSFNRADETPLTGWSGSPANWSVSSNQLAPTTTVAGLIYSDTTVPTGDQEAYVTLSTFNTGSYNILMVRCKPGDLDCYSITFGFGYAVITRRDNWAETSLQGYSVTWNNGDKVGIRCVGNRIEAWVFQSGSWSMLGAVIDETYDGLSGDHNRIALYHDGSGGGTTARFDDFAGGTPFSGVTARVPLTIQGATAAGFEPVEIGGGGIIQTPPPGGGIAAGQTPTARVTASPGGALGQGLSPTARAILTIQGATGQGFSTTSRTQGTIGGATGQGLGPTAKIPLTQGGATGGGFTTSSRSTATIGGALGQGVGATAKIPLTPGGAIAGGVTPIAPMIETPLRGGAIAGGRAPIEFIYSATAARDRIYRKYVRPRV